jgi:uncharacterized repeat protein (TIGR03803 family)
VTGKFLQLGLHALIIGLVFMLARPASAQTFITLHSFSATPATSGSLYTNSDGAAPYGGLVLAGNTLFGTTFGGGPSSYGTVFAVNTDGSGFTNVYTFTRTTDGANPRGGLLLSGDTLYGVSSAGGSRDKGTVFAINTNGTGFTSLHSFIPQFSVYNESDPRGTLVLSGNTLFGTTFGGSVFAINADGTGFTNLCQLSSNPWGSPALSGNTVFGMTRGGTAFTWGNIFAVYTDGTGYTNLHAFTAGADGAAPYDGLILSGNTLYGAASGGGASGEGTILAINTDGTDFTNLYSFSPTGPGTSGASTNSDGADPYGGLILSGNTLYGTTTYGGNYGNGTVFAVHTDGSGFTALYSFSAPAPNSAGVYTNSDGTFPRDGLFLAGNTLYGTTSTGGASGNGTVFSLSLPPALPQLSIACSGTNIFLSWPTNTTGYTLQSTTNLGSPALWTPVEGQNPVTNPISGSQQFFRLQHP